MMEVQGKNTVTMVEGTGGRFRWIAITALLLAIGTILRLVSPGFGPITPNWTIAMYCIAIILIKPSIPKALGIGLVAGAIGVVSSKSAFPYANLLSEPVGAITCAILVNIMGKVKIGKINLSPAICGLLSTLASGMTFVTGTKLVLALPMKVYLYTMIPVVLTVAAVNTIVTQVLYFPAHKIFAKGEEE